MHKKPFISWTYSIWYSHKTAGFDGFNKITAILGVRRSAFYPPVRKQGPHFSVRKIPIGWCAGSQVRKSAKYPRPVQAVVFDFESALWSAVTKVLPGVCVLHTSAPVPKCLGAEVSWGRSVSSPKYHRGRQWSAADTRCCCRALFKLTTCKAHFY